MEKVFLDTNILLDFLTHREGCKEASTLLDMGKRREIELYCTGLTIANCIYICRKVLGNELATECMRELCKFLHISPIGQEECEMAFKTSNPDFEDAMQYYSAKKAKVDVILSRNVKHFRYSTIPVKDSKTYLNQKN